MVASPTQTRFRLAFALMCGFLIGLAGCGGNANLADVQGTVKLDGNPLPNAFVTFTPESGGATSFAKTSEDGTYRMQFTDSETGAFIGSNRVCIRTGDVKPDNSGRLKELVPVVYNDKTTLVAAVKSGGNTFDWELESDAGKVIQPELGE